MYTVYVSCSSELYTFQEVRTTFKAPNFKVGFLTFFPNWLLYTPWKTNTASENGPFAPPKKQGSSSNRWFSEGENVSFRKSKVLEICFTQQKILLNTQPTLQTWERFF